MRLRRKASIVLNEAADLIEERGWGKGACAWGLNDHSPLCIEGAIIEALGEKWHNVHPMEIRDSRPYQAVLEFLGWAEGPLYRWNDTKCEDIREVIAVLRAAALVEEAREQAKEIQQKAAKRRERHAA